MTADGVKPRPERAAATAGRPARVVAGDLVCVGFIAMGVQAEVFSAQDRITAVDVTAGRTGSGR